MRLSEIRVKQIRVSQGLGVQTFDQLKICFDICPLQCKLVVSIKKWVDINK